MKTFRSFSSRETEKLGSEIARRALVRRRRTRRATVFALAGDLGSGKTTFVRGFFRGAGIRRRPASPTFILVRRTPLDRGGFANIFHVDAYRIRRRRELAALGMREMLRDPRNLVIVEWAEKVRRALPKDATWVMFSHGASAHERTLTVQGSAR
jgi:tRNA threonylcarbamoyladenosine biosynthesis protein TsaE